MDARRWMGQLLKQEPFFPDSTASRFQPLCAPVSSCQGQPACPALPGLSTAGGLSAIIRGAPPLLLRVLQPPGLASKEAQAGSHLSKLRPCLPARFCPREWAACPEWKPGERAARGHHTFSTAQRTACQQSHPWTSHGKPQDWGHLFK